VKGADIIIAARTSGHSVLSCLKKILAGINKH